MSKPASDTKAGRQAVLGIAENKILEALLRYHYLSSRQVCRLFYRPGSLTYVQTKLKHLTDSGFLQRIFLPRTSQYGSAPAVYTLARKGLNCLKNQGLEVNGRYHPSEERQHSYLFLSHTLAVNDILMAAELLCRGLPEISLSEVLHERELKRSPVKVELDGEKLSVIPDGWLDFRLSGSEQMCLLLELDQGTVEQKRWRRKVRGLLACSKGPYQETFKTTSLTIIVASTSGEKRLSDLLQWTESELLELGKDSADLFRFAGLTPADIDPQEIFLAPIWYRPFDRQALPLLDGIS